MNKALKWMIIIAGSLVALIVVAVIVATLVVDVNQYKPRIEQEIAKATGRSFKLGGEIKPSFFPWIGVRLSDLHLGNPSGFKEQDFVSVESFEVRVKLLPLLSRHIEVKRFVMNRPTIVLERRKNGQASWEGLGQTANPPAAAKEKQQKPPTGGDLPIKGLAVNEFAITDGLVVWIDDAAGVRNEIKQINLSLSDVSLDKPVGVNFSALADQKPLSLEGSIGPVGPQPGKRPLPLDLALKLLDALDVKLAGTIDPSATPAKFDLKLNVADFSPRKVMEQLDQKLPIQPADPAVLTAVGLSCNLKGSPQIIDVSDGKLRLDDSQATFSARAADFAKPDLKFDLNLDAIDVDRYLPPAKDQPDAAPAKESSAKAAPGKNDYGPLRRLVLDARVAIGRMTAKKAQMQNIEVRVTARNGIIRLDPMKVDLYKGGLTGSGTVNVQKDQPATDLQMVLKGVQAGPLIKDVMAKDILEGAMAADIDMSFTGDAPERIRKSLDGKGDLRFTDGAIVGIDLAAMVRNVGNAFGLAQNPSQRPRTDFSELLMPFTITNGLFKTTATRLNSPLLRVLVTGSADLPKETLDFRVDPKFVATIKGQGDSTQRSGVQVPVMISGSFDAPTFTPDLAAILNQPLPDKESLKQLIPPTQDKEKLIQEGVKGLFKSLGNQ